ncbi:histidine phosphatase family protein [Paenibacillus psychroresistens]|uniref:Histidine phosphatase family protein n=1 Tax=Paenibacillus psychroresistens TaxID=1778678 RepID=A0A6B8RGV8_9BACL|nr:histidine phosphatase family protein [Paenibacillus psychroresistens]QGQ94616.1 histidine phosphatase family protein [Paenibacillus psychroresistens]
MTIFGIIRHGVTDWNQQGRAQGQEDVPLNIDGIRQAELLGNRFSQESWDYIYSSDLSRASATAEKIAGALNMKITGFDPRLREKTHGRLDGTTVEERIALWGENWKDLDHNEESDEHMLVRSLSLLNELKERHPQSRVLLISHGAWIRSLLAELFKEMEITFLNNTCVTVIQNQEDPANEWKCLLFNCTKHLQEVN